MDARLILDAPAPGAWNMAVDEALFQHVVTRRTAVLRLYQWAEPTLSLGYFQRVEERGRHEPSRGLPLVRRSTGGGAIVHDRELTYSLVLPLRDDRPATARTILALVHATLVELFADLRLKVRPHAGAGESPAEDEPFLCFCRRSPHDLVLGDAKVVGSAQRRQRQALLQHGSLLLRRSPAAPELAGIEDLSTATGLLTPLLQLWPVRLAAALQLTLTASELTAQELQTAEEVQADRFAADRWNRKR